MDFVAQLNRFLDPLRTSIKSLICRAIVSFIDDSKGMQIVQVELRKDEVKDGVERVQNYGFTSHPVKDAEAVVLFVNGNRDNGLCIAVDDTRYRMKSLPEGGVAVYDHDGNYVKLTETNGIELEAPNQKVTIKASGDIEIGNSNLKKLVNEEFQDMFNNHVHQFTDIIYPAGTPSTAVTGKPANVTGSGAPDPGSNPMVVPALPISIGNNELTSKVKAE